MSQLIWAVKRIGENVLNLGWIRRFLSSTILLLLEGFLGLSLFTFGITLFFVRALQPTVEFKEVITPFLIMSLGEAISFVFFSQVLHRRYRVEIRE